MKAPRIVLVYHGVQPGHPACLDPGLFSDQMEYLCARFAVWPLQDILAGRENVIGGAICVTFDDGYRNFIQYALPALQRNRIPATLYVPTGYIGRTNEWDRDGETPLLPLMGEQDLLDIQAEGVSIGSHTRTHQRLRGLGKSEMDREIKDSKKILEDLTGSPVRSFSYPYGGRIDFDGPAVEAVEGAGYEEAVSTCFGRFNTPRDRFKIRRITVPPKIPLWKFILILNGYYDWIAGKEALTFWLRRKSGFFARPSARKGEI